MFKLKKLIMITAIILCITALFSFCSCKVKDGTAYSFYAPDGAPSVAVGKLILDKQNFGLDKGVNYNVVSSEEITTYMNSADADIILLPVNAASKLYKVNKNSHYKMVSVITHGNLYISSKTQITLQDLKGNVIGVTGANLVPDLTLKATLKAKGIKYAVVNGFDKPAGDTVGIYYSQAPVIKNAIKEGNILAGLLPEPAVSTGFTNTYFRIPLHEEYDENLKSFPQAVLMVKESLVNNFAGLREMLKLKFEESFAFCKTDTETAIQAVKSIYPATTLTAQSMTLSVIDNCKIYWQDSLSAKTEVNGYIERILEVCTDTPAAARVYDDFYL